MAERADTTDKYRMRIFISQQNRINIGQLAIRFPQLSEEVLQRELRYLEKKGFIVREGNEYVIVKIEKPKNDEYKPIDHNLVEAFILSKSQITKRTVCVEFDIYYSIVDDIFEKLEKEGKVFQVDRNLYWVISECQEITKEKERMLVRYIMENQVFKISNLVEKFKEIKLLEILQVIKKLEKPGIIRRIKGDLYTR